MIYFKRWDPVFQHWLWQIGICRRLRVKLRWTHHKPQKSQSISAKSISLSSVFINLSFLRPGGLAALGTTTITALIKFIFIIFHVAFAFVSPAQSLPRRAPNERVCLREEHAHARTRTHACHGPRGSWALHWNLRKDVIVVMSLKGIRKVLKYKMR